MVVGGLFFIWYVVSGRGEGIGVRAIGIESRGGEEEFLVWGFVRGGGLRLFLEVGFEL